MRPGAGNGCVKQAALARMSAEMLETVGLIAKRNEETGYLRPLSRSRDVPDPRRAGPHRRLRRPHPAFVSRIGGSTAPKYYNSRETPLFSKSEQLYGIDQARQAATKAGYLAIVEGYTDVLMAHQHGIGQRGGHDGHRAERAAHRSSCAGSPTRVVLVFDADAGGERGVDRALEIFVSHDLDLRIATLPDGLDPCDLLAAQGPEPFRQALDQAIDVLEYKLQRVWDQRRRQAASRDSGARSMRCSRILALAPTSVR